MAPDTRSSSTRSIRTSVFDYVYEHGRRYHGYSQGCKRLLLIQPIGIVLTSLALAAYLLPNDDVNLLLAPFILSTDSVRLGREHTPYSPALGV
jgi:hypothetical protein